MNKNALITGGSRGIGLGIARKLAAEGYDLAINGVRPEEQVEETLQELKNTGVEVIYCQGNISLKADREKILDKITSQFGHLDFLINNAGIAPRERRDLLEATEESFSEVLQTNLQGPYFLTQAAAKLMIREKSAKPDFEAGIINITSISATVASVNRGEYCVAKAGLSMTTALFSARLGEYNIPVYEVRPGIIKTDMTAGVTDKYDKLIAEGLTIQPRWGTPEDIGKVVASLVRGDLPYSSGSVIMVDGGLTVPRL
jgi:NAD(P)-dependent dehydrogenase (short-subunit alcohol dehydrogenase family)